MSDKTRVPKVGDTVWYYPPSEDLVGRSNNNRGVVAAKITRAWGDTRDTALNLKIFPDHGPVQDRGSVASMYAVKGTRTWCFPGDFKLDSEGAPIFESSEQMDTING
jgi:hypothetical protein